MCSNWYFTHSTLGQRSILPIQCKVKGQYNNTLFVCARRSVHIHIHVHCTSVYTYIVLHVHQCIYMYIDIIIASFPDSPLVREFFDFVQVQG